MLLSLLLPALLLFAGSADCVDERRCVEDVRQASCSRFFSGAVSIGHAGSSSSSGSGNSFPPTQAPWSSTFPNARNLTLVEALIEFRAYEKLLSVSNYCSYLLHSFLCIHYFPPCDPTAVSKSPLVVPCRQLCELATEECLDYVFDKYNISRPEHLNCSHFPERDTECTSAEKEVVLTACPTPAVHFDFNLPLDEKNIEVAEDNETVDVCIKLVSTGSHDSLQTPVVVKLDFEDQSAKGGEDYFANYTKFCFGVGSVKGDVKCCKVKIINDCLVEGTEKFTAHATVRVKKHNVTDQDCGQSGDGDRRHDNSSVGCNGDGGQEGEDSVGTCTGRNRGQGTANDGGTDGEGRCGRRGGRRDGVEGNRRRNNRIDTNTDNNCENEGDVIDDSAGKSNDEGNNTDCDAGRNNDEGSGEEDDYNGGRDGPPLFGGSLNSRTGSIDIFIDDDDMCVIKPKFCESEQCNQRKNAGGNTFARNNYTYAAHVELLQIRQFSECTGVDVRIIECWEINEGNHCPDVGKCITIPTCTGCPTISPLPGDHLLIAGVWQTVKGKKMVILPNSKQTGLFSIWKDKYANVEQWIQRIRK